MNKERLHVIVLVGLPGCGKTTWAKTYYSQFLHVDGDSLKTSAKVSKAVREGLQQNRNVIVDATNVTLQRRADIIEVGKQFNALCYAVVFRLTSAQCMERAKKRELEGGPHIPTVAFNTINARYVDPQLSEGFVYIGEVLS